MQFHPIKQIRQRLRRAASVREQRTTRDQVLARRLFRRFEHDLQEADVQGLHFYVQDGIVTLYGTMRHDLDREMLEDLVRGITGVREVISNLQTVSPVHRVDVAAGEHAAAPREA